MYCAFSAFLDPFSILSSPSLEAMTVPSGPSSESVGQDGRKQPFSPHRAAVCHPADTMITDRRRFFKKRSVESFFTAEHPPRPWAGTQLPEHKSGPPIIWAALTCVSLPAPMQIFCPVWAHGRQPPHDPPPVNGYGYTFRNGASDQRFRSLLRLSGSIQPLELSPDGKNHRQKAGAGADEL